MVGSQSSRAALLVLLVVLVGCGRVSFDPVEDAGADGATIDAGLEDGLVALYRMEDAVATGRVVDSSGNALDGACSQGGTCFIQVPGVLGNSIRVTGPGTVLVTDDPRLHLTGGFTVALWLLREGGTTPISKPQLVGDGAAFEIVTAPAGISFCTDDSLTAEVFDCINSGLPVMPTWTHVAVTWDGVRKTLYVDGARVASALAMTKFDAAPLSIGSDFVNNTITSQFAGSLDNVRIYARVLGASEVLSLYNGKL